MSRAEKHALQGKLTTDDTNGRLCFSLSRLVLEEIKLGAESCQESVSSGNVVRSGCSASAMFTIHPKRVVSFTRLKPLRGECFRTRTWKMLKVPPGALTLPSVCKLKHRFLNCGNGSETLTIDPSSRSLATKQKRTAEFVR